MSIPSSPSSLPLAELSPGRDADVADLRARFEAQKRKLSEFWAGLAFLKEAKADWREPKRIHERVACRGEWIGMLDRRKDGWCWCRLDQVASVERTPGYEVVVRTKQGEFFTISDCDGLLEAVMDILAGSIRETGEPS
jgi:hypothetical protein